MAAAAATADPPGYFVGRPVHYQTVPPPEPPMPPAVDEQNAVNTQVPGYYRGRVPQTPSRGTDEHINNNNNAGAAVQPNREQPSCIAKWFGGCFFSGSS